MGSYRSAAIALAVCVLLLLLVWGINWLSPGSFEDRGGPPPPGMRHCINSASLKFVRR